MLLKALLSLPDEKIVAALAGTSLLMSQSRLLNITKRTAAIPPTTSTAITIAAMLPPPSPPVHSSYTV